MNASLEIAALLQDPIAVHDAMADELSCMTDTSLRVHAVTLDYFRQSPARISVQYTLDLEAADGLQGSQIITLTHFTNGRTERQWTRLCEEAPDADALTGPFQLPGAQYLAALQSIMQVFPFDGRLPGLRAVVAGTPRVKNLLLPDTPDSVTYWKADVVRYRPDMRAMTRIAFTAGSADHGAMHQVYAKAYRDVEEGQRAFDLLVALEVYSNSAHGFQVPRPLAYDAELRTLFLAEAAGERLLDIVRKQGDERAPSAIRRAARAVASLHTATLPAGLLPTIRVDKDMQFVDVAARLMQAFPEQAAAVRSLTQQIEAIFQPAPLQPTHYDLKQGHILIDAASVTILDFDKMAMGDPLIDVANVVATLGAERESSARRAARRADLSELFVDEYFRQVPHEWAALFPAHLARATMLEAATTGRGNRGRKGAPEPKERLTFALRRVEDILAS